ncbi:MAG: flagellar motor protein MotB [Tepidimonas sp.]|uniref:flagellar motor protein MotB n=1 Tax=Tepidimonas sp. TaxID=2002775 RepID=UPI00298F0B8D|nr:flagellar motor protein MotB [Tepidimonas sp.]MCS6811806.1 flagellar motor protein MotB [Tepidimonas sp.]MDW8336438.1 flagellar motor protein MotB [Tepidimonas sp.]
MAASGKPLQPIIIKRVKKGGHGAHGGAWKIAYADFVTAMMAFFLLMWLLGSTTEGDRKGIADYFNQPLKVMLFGGPGSGGATSILQGGGDDLTKSVGEVASGDVEDKVREIGAQLARAEAIRLDKQRIATLRDKISEIINVNPKLAEYKNQIRLEMVQDGLHIQIVDEQNRPMFDAGSALVKPYLRDILRAIAQVLQEVDNRISLSGHTDATPYGSGERAYSNWELSADRANATRRELVAAGLPEGKLARVVGMADKQLLFPENPTDPRNRRISILVLTREAEERMTRSLEAAAEVSDAGQAQQAVKAAPAASARPSQGR